MCIETGIILCICEKGKFIALFKIPDLIGNVNNKLIKFTDYESNCN